MKNNETALELMKATMEAQEFLLHMKNKYDPLIAFDSIGMAIGIWCRETGKPKIVMERMIRAMNLSGGAEKIMTDDRTPEISVAISLETLVMLEMRMREGDTYDKVIRALTEAPLVLEGIIVNLTTASRMIRDDIKRTVDIDSLRYSEEPGGFPSRLMKKTITSTQVSAVMHAENILALNDAVKAVFDE
jgi:hypothetical protein